MKKPARKTAAPRKKPAKQADFFHKPTCSTCRKTRKFLEARGYHLNVRDLIKHPLSVTELEDLIGSRDASEFLRTKDAAQQPVSRAQAIQKMAGEPNLIRRPIVVAGGRVVIGFDERGMAKL
ncbi:MAG TPA: ArsC/Spx/MgsR family protein [Methylomirabilota bacterium]|jgi:arsenate reductase/regulatory protein spx|nr:ArsC/Spx/MgsR family protein [Methylomirabilota bacterium]